MTDPTSHPVLAAKPPMGWNSFDCFNASVTEDEIKQHADILAADLLRYGWEYIVVDFCWSDPAPKLLMAPDQTMDEKGNYHHLLEMDEYSRLLPAPNRFPSSANGNGFKPLADYVHGKGLKFGIHIMRGIPRQAVKENTRILASKVHAADIADTGSVCPWLNQMYGLDMSKPGAQAYYDSLFQLYASWEVDFIKVDDISFPYHGKEIEAIQQAIQNCGRPMILSLSPGPTPVSKAAHLKQYANMWRISGDFFDSWVQLKNHFALCAAWGNISEPGHWADADMLPLGLLDVRGPNSNKSHMTRFTRNEQFALMTLCAIFCSPLMFGGHLPSLDDFTRSLMTNEEVLAVNQNSSGNHQFLEKDNMIAWIANVLDSSDKYLAVFNIGEGVDQITINLANSGLTGFCRIRDLWQRTDLPNAFVGTFSPSLPAHSGSLYRVTPLKV